MKQIIIPLLVVAGLFSCKQQEEDLSGQVAEFYKAYAESFFGNDSEVLRKYLTPGLIEKADRMSIDYDVIVHGQDIYWKGMEDGVLPPIENLGGGWYRFTNGHVNLKAEMVDGSFKITYISPDDRWGDEMIAPKDEKVPQVDDTSSAKEFVETFYDAYLYWYCQMPENLESKLSYLRDKYLSEFARRRYEYEVKSFEGSYAYGYDVLISAHDFEYISLKTVEVEQLSNENQFLVTYRRYAPENDFVNFIYVMVEKSDDGSYVISDFTSSELTMYSL